MNQMVLLVLIVVGYIALFVFLISLRNKKETKRRIEIEEKLGVGSRIETVSCMRGTIVEINEKDAIVEFSCDPEKSIRAKILLGGIRTVLD